MDREGGEQDVDGDDDFGLGFGTDGSEGAGKDDARPSAGGGRNIEGKTGDHSQRKAVRFRLAADGVRRGGGDMNDPYEDL